MEIDYFQGKVDTSSVRWINDCEYIVKKRNPPIQGGGKIGEHEDSVHQR